MRNIWNIKVFLYGIMVIWNYEEIFTQRNGDTHFVAVDDKDFHLLNDKGWYAHEGGNTFYCVKNPDLKLHRIIMGLEKNDKRVVDHIDGNGLNNKRYNLRICSRQENSMNAKTKKTNKSGFKGVSWHTKDKRWIAQICFNGKKYRLGAFTDPEKASEVYKKKAIEFFKEFARL